MHPPLSMSMSHEPETSLDENCSGERGNIFLTLNAAQSSTRNLPPEILSIIFQYACPTPDLPESCRSYYLGGTGGLRQSRRHFVLAAVSSTWRQVVDATPQLWRSVVLNYDNPQLLELHITRIGSLHLSLELHTPPPWLRVKIRSLSGGHILSKVAPKLGSLVLANLEDDALDYLSILEFPFLERIGILWKDRRDLSSSNLEVTGAPVLQHFSLHALPHFETFHLELPWSSITSLHFVRVPTYICIQALHQCQNLVVFHCQAVHGTWGFANHMYRAPLTLPHLEIFHWPCNIDGPAIRDLFWQLQLPVLESLKLGCGNATNETSVRLFQNLPQTLQKLQFSAYEVHVDAGTPYSARLFEHIPYLRELVVDHCSTHFIDDILAALALHDSFTGDPKYLPNLRTLIVAGSFPPLNFDVLHITREMVKKRFAGQAELPTLSFSTVANSDVPQEPKIQRVTLVIDDRRRCNFNV